jgi:hypothetical protein
MKHPIKDDFAVEVLEAGGGVEVLFKPTRSYYTYSRLADPNDIKRFGPLSQGPNVRHAGPTGDTGDYRSDQVEQMAYSLASDAAKAGG